MRLGQLAQYVQAVATANPEHAVAIVSSAGMYLKRSRGPGARGLRAEQKLPREVTVKTSRAAKTAGYEFQYSLDGSVTWLPFPQVTTTRASATLSGLKPGSTVHFRYRATVKGVTGNWSDSIAIIVT